MVKALVDYDGWLKHEQWNISDDMAKRKADELVKDKHSRVEMVQLYKGSYLMYHRRSYQKTNACRL